MNLLSDGEMAMSAPDSCPVGTVLSLVGVQTPLDGGVREAFLKEVEGKRRDLKGRAGLYKASSSVFWAEELTHAKSYKQDMSGLKQSQDRYKEGWRWTSTSKTAFKTSMDGLISLTVL